MLARTPRALAFFALALATRLPLRASEFWAHDSVLYTRAVEIGFDPPAHQPQPPGYLYYVLLVRALSGIAGDPTGAMTVISAVAGATAVALLYVLAARLYDERTGVMAALFLMTSVTFWGQSLIALPYALLGALTILVALLLWRAMEPGTSVPPATRGGRLALASLAWGLAIGFRSDLAVFLAPVWLLAALATPLSWTVVSAAIAAATTLAWLGATVALTPGGAIAYFSGLREHIAFIDERYSVSGRGLDALANNVRELARFMGRALFALAPLAAVALLPRGMQRAELRAPRRAAFLILWTIAPLPANVLVHAGEYGYVFTMLPGICIIAARATLWLAETARRPRLAPWLAGAAVATNAAVFLFSDQPLSRHDVAKRDEGVVDRVAAIGSVEPREQVVVVTAYDKVLVEAHLPGRRIVAYLPDAAPSLDVPLTCGGTPTCLVYAWDEYFRTGTEWRTIDLRRGGRLRVAEVPPGTTLRIRDGLALELAR